jgi:hypothetical protein
VDKIRDHLTALFVDFALASSRFFPADPSSTIPSSPALIFESVMTPSLTTATDLVDDALLGFLGRNGRYCEKQNANKKRNEAKNLIDYS